MLPCLEKLLAQIISHNTATLEQRGSGGLLVQC